MAKQSKCDRKCNTLLMCSVLFTPNRMTGVGTDNGVL